jgi:L-aminopeptidase/D-esterase-like protein
VLQRAVHVAADAFYQAAMNAHNGAAGIGKVPAGTTSGTTADQNKGGSAPPPPTAPPPPPPPPPPH